MSEAERKVPKLRFPGFTEDWEQRKLGDVYKEVKSGLSRMLSNEDIGLPVVRANNINDGQLNLYDDIKYWYKNDPQGSNTDNYIINKNDILINFINSESKMGTAAFVEKEPCRDTIYTTNILRCRVDDECDPYFVYITTFLKSYRDYIKSITKPAVNQASFTTVDFKKFEIVMPVIEEQVKISNIIKKYNCLITLHQRKLENLKLKKKALLQKLFPKNGEQFPELRFPGFTDAWEQRKLGEIVKVYDNLRVPIAESDRILGNTPYYGANGIQGYIDGYTHNGEFILIAEDGANDLENYPIRYVSGKVWVNNHAHVVSGLEDTISTKFLGYSLKRSDIKSYIVGGSRSKLNLSDMLKVEVSYPKLGEQTQIHRIMDKIDAIITLHQRKLEHLQLQKKALLQQMFV